VPQHLTSWNGLWTGRSWLWPEGKNDSGLRSPSWGYSMLTARPDLQTVFCAINV
jgi:hypothetical protein